MNNIKSKVINSRPIKYVFTKVNKIILDRSFKKGKIKINPDLIYFAVTNICNSNCRFCAYQYNESPKQVMSFETFKKGLDQYHEMNGKIVNLTPLAGEPLIDKNIFEKIKYAKSKNMYTIFNTNAILLNVNENYKKIIDSGLDLLQISSPGLDDAAYKRVYRINKYPDILNGIKNILDYKEETGSKIQISLMARRDRAAGELRNDEGIKKIQPYTEKGLIYIDYEGYYEMDSWCGHIKQEDLTGIMRIKQADSKKPNIPCVRMVRIISILPDGSVRLCGCRYYKTEIDDLIIGNINNNSLKEIFRSKEFYSILKNSFDGKWPVACDKCSLYGQYSPLLKALRMQ